MRLYRLTSRRDPTEAFSGEGARRVAGRWHPKGVRLVYTSSSIALALVETLVHLDPEALDVFLHAVEVPNDAIETLSPSAYPADWARPKRSDQARAYGAAWVSSNRSLGLAVPSVVVPEEHNVLLNPGHPTFASLTIEGPSPFSFDQRLLHAAARKRPRRRR